MANRKIRFQRVGSAEDPSGSAQEGRFTIAEHQEIQQAFGQHLSEGSSPGAAARCRIIWCVIGPEETTCAYRCD